MGPCIGGGGKRALAQAVGNDPGRACSRATAGTEGTCVLFNPAATAQLLFPTSKKWILFEEFIHTEQGKAAAIPSAPTGTTKNWEKAFLAYKEVEAKSKVWNGLEPGVLKDGIEFCTHRPPTSDKNKLAAYAVTVVLFTVSLKKQVKKLCDALTEIGTPSGMTEAQRKHLKKMKDCKDEGKGELNDKLIAELKSLETSLNIAGQLTKQACK